MSKFFKSLLLLLSAGLFTATGWAVTLINPNPTASFTDFSTIPTGTTDEAKTLTVNGVTLTLPIGVTKNDDGTVNLNGVGATVGLSTPPSSATIVLDLAAAPGSGTIVSIPYKEDTGAVVSLKYDGTNLYTSWQDGGARQSGAWTAAATKVLFSNTSGGGTYAIADTVNLNDTGLHSSTKTISTIYIGSYKGTENSYMDLKIKGVYVYSGSKLTAMPTFTEVSAYERTIDGTENWTDEDWGVDNVTNPQEGMPVVLNVTGNSTLTMNEASNELAQLDIEGDANASLTITGANKLTSSVTIVGANTVVDAGAADLGAVSITEGNILTVKETPTNVYSSLGNYGALCLDAGDATTPLTIDNNNALGKILLADGAVVKMTATGGNKIYNVEGVADAEVKPELRLHSGQNWGVTIPGSAFKNVKLVLPEKNSNDGSGTYSFWLTPSTLANDASVDLEIKGGQGLTFENVNSVTAVFGSFVTNGAFSGTTVQTGTGEISGSGGTTNITVTNSGAGTFTVARAYGSSLTIGSNGRVTVAEGGSLTGAVSVTGALTYATNATPTNTITNNGTITADTATVDLTGATISGSGTYGVTNGGTLILDAGTENGASVTSGTLKLLLSHEYLINGYSANVANGTVVTFIKAGVSGYEIVSEGKTVYELPAKDGLTLTATVGTGDGQVTAWTGVGEDGFVYRNTTLAIHFTENDQTFTFDNTLGVALTSLTVTAEAGVTGCTIALPATEGLVIAAATAINADVTVTGQGALGEVTVAGGKALTVKSFVMTSFAKGEGEGNAIVTLDATDAAISHATAFTVPAGITLKTKGTVTLSGTNTIASGATLEVVSGETTLSATGQGIKGTVTIDAGATLKNGVTDALAYDTNGVVVNVYGTLDLGSTRWTIFANKNTINAYAGATITGVGQANNGALDIWNKANDAVAINVLKNGADATDVTIAATIRYRELSVTFNIEEGMTANLTGTNADIDTIEGGLKIKGNGTLKLSGKNTYNGNVGVTVESGATLIVAHTEALATPVLNAGTIIYAVSLAPTNTIRGDGLIVADGEGTLLDLTGATIPGNGTYGVTNGATLIVDAGTENGASVTSGTLKLLLSEMLLKTGYTANVADGTKVTFIKAGAEDYETVESNGNTYELPAKDGETLTATVGSGDGQVIAWSGVREEGFVYKNTNLTIHFTANDQTFTFDNTLLDVDLASLIVTAEEGVNGGTIVLGQDCKRVVCDALTLNTTVSADAAFYATNTGAIDGSGKLCLASGELTLDEANTYTGGTDIAAGATLTITNAGALGTGAITGAGTLVCDGVLPTNTNAMNLTDSTNWRGTFWLKNWSWTSKTPFPINNYASNKSTLCLDSVTGTESYISPGTNGSSYPINICLKNNGWKSQNGNSGAKLTFSGALSGDGILDLTHGTPSSGQMYMFTGEISEFCGTVKVNANQIVAFGEVTSSYTSSKSEGQRWTVGESISPEGRILIAKPVTIAQGKIWTAKNGVMVLSTGTISGSGTIDSALTLANDATIDTTGGAVKVTGAVTLPDALTVKIAVAPTVGAAVPLLNASNVTIPDGMDVTVMVGDTPAEGTYQLIKTPTALLLENAPTEDVTIEASNIAAAELYAADQMGNYDSHGVQVDLDGPTPYAPGWVSGVCYPLVSVGVVSDADDRVAAGTCVQVVATDDPTVVVATSAPFQNENKEDVTVTSSNGTNTYKLYTFKFETPVYVDAAKTYQFRFVNGEGAAVTCKLRALYTSANQSYCNWLNAQYEVIDVNNVPTRYAPYVVLTAKRIVDNSPICRGGDEILEVATVPEKIRLDTKTFGYGTHTVLQYTGGTTDWSTMDVEGLPAGAEVITDGNSWGFAIKTLNVLTVGDSITAGLVTYHNSKADWHVPGGYRLPLYKYLTRAGYTVKYLGASDVFGTYSGGKNPDEANPSPSLGENDHHEGHSGTTLEEAYDRFGQETAQQVIASQGTPDVITLHLGTNDMQTQAQDTDDSVGNQFAEMKKLIYRLNGVCDSSATDAWKSEIGTPLYPNAKIIVAKIIPRGDSDNQAKVDKFNPMLSSYVESCNSDNLILVTLPMGEGTNYGYYRHDYLHPSTEGYTQMAKGWFDAIDDAFDPFGEPTEATTPVASTATTDVTEENPATIGIRSSTSKTIGPFKAAEWTTFTNFATGYISQFGYMPESERPWQLDVRGTNVPAVNNGVLSLNGAPLTVNVVDGRLGTTSGTYTAVLAVSNLAANDVIFTDAAVQCTDWPNAKGSAVADLFKMTVVDATTLKVQYNENTEQTVSLTGVDLTDATPEVLAVVVKSNACSIFVNGTKVATNVSLGTAIGESYRGNFSIGALSADNAGSAMKLYRLSFYEGEVTAIAAPIATTATINVGEGDGQYITWKTAKEALKLSDEMESLTLNFTADAQNFTFDNDAAVTIDAVTVQGTAGGTIANAGTATVTATSLAINTNVTMNKCYIVDKYTLPIETTNNIAIAQNCALTYYINGAQSTVTVAATHSGAGKIVKTSYGTLEITNTCAVNVDVNQGLFKVNVPINGEKKSIENQKTVKLTGSTLILTSGLSYATFDGDETSIIRVDGDYTFGISNSFTNDLDAGEIQIEAGKTLTIRNYKSGYVLSPSKLLRVNGTLQRDASNGQDFKVQISDTATLEGSGSITQAIELAAGATVHCTATALAVNTVAFAEGTLNVTGADALAEGETVTLFRTTAYAAATGRVEGVVARRVATADETNYRLYKTADAIEVWPSATDAETWTVDAATATTWADVVNQMAAANKRPVDTTALTIDFGDIDGEAVPGTFTFGEGDVTLGSITVIGSNGGTIATMGTVTVSTSATINTAVAINGQIQLNGLTIAEGAELAITNYAVVGSPVSGAGTLKITGATLNRGFEADLVSNTWTGTVVLEDIDDNNLDLRYLVNDSITSTEGVLTITASSSITIEGIVKAYIYDGAIDTLTLNGTLQLRNGTTTKKKTQCVTVNTLAGAGMFKVAEGAAFCTAINVKTWAGFSGSIDIGYSVDTQNTIVFLGEAPDRFTDAASNTNTADDAQEYFANDYGTIYVTEGNLVTAVGSTWKARKVNIANGTSLTIQGWFGASESITGLSANTIVGGVKDGENVVEAGVLDLRALDNLSGVNVTVKAGGRLLVNTGATVPNSIVFEEGSILGVATKHVEDVGNATLTVNVDGTAATTATIKGYHMDGVTLLDNWAKNNETSSEGEFKFNFDPVFDGELCWWAYEFDNEVNTSPESNLGPISTGRDKGRMNFDGRGDSNRVCQDNEYLDHGDGTKAIRVASSPWRDVSGGYPTAFTAAMYGTLTSSRNRIIMGFGSSYNQKYTIALVTGASTDEVRLVLQKGWNENNQDYPEDAVITLATTTVPNAVTENHLFAFSYEQFDSEDDDEELDSTRIIFYVDGEKYQPFTAKAIIPLGNGFQMGSIHGGWHNSLTRMNGDDVNCTMEYLRIYDQILPESVWTAMSNEYSYMSKNGRATRTIVEGQDATWNENTEWTQIRAVKDGKGDYVLDTEGHVTFDNGTDVEKPDHGENVGTQVVLNVDGANTLFLNEFYSNPIQEGEVSKLYYERLEINPVNQSGDSLTLWAGRNNPAIEEGDPLKNSQSAVINVQGYTKINTNVTMAHNVAFLSGPVSVAEGKRLLFDFSGFDVMKVPSMPVTYRLTGFLDEDTRTRVTSTKPADPVNARSIDLGYKTTVNQYTFTVNRYPVTAYFTADEMAGGNSTEVNFNDLNYVWQGNHLGKQMNWEAEAVDPQGNPIVENTLAKFVSLDAETQQEKMVTVTLATNDADPITLTLDEAALTKETTPAGTDGEGNPTEAVVENMLGEQQLIVGDKVIVNYTGTAATLARTLNEASAETTGVIRTAGFTVDAWRANLSVTGGALAGTGTISGKVTFEEGATLDARAATAEACLSAKDADLTNLKAITVNVDAAAGKTLKVLDLPVGHTAKSLEGCVVTAVDGEGETVATWTESNNDPTRVALVVVREDGLYVTGRPVVKAGETEVKNNDLTLPLARRAAELSATSVSLTAVKSLDGLTTITTDAESVATAAECFTGIAFDVDKAENSEVATASLRYNFGVSQMNIISETVTEGENMVTKQYVVAELIVSNAADLANNSADYADGVTVDVVVKKGEVTQTLTMTPVADMAGAETMPATVEKAKRYIRFQMPDGNGTFEIKARAKKAAPAQQQ